MKTIWFSSRCQATSSSMHLQVNSCFRKWLYGRACHRYEIFSLAVLTVSWRTFPQWVWLFPRWWDTSVHSATDPCLLAQSSLKISVWWLFNHICASLSPESHIQTLTKTRDRARDSTQTAFEYEIVLEPFTSCLTWNHIVRSTCQLSIRQDNIDACQFPESDLWQDNAIIDSMSDYTLTAPLSLEWGGSQDKKS